MEVDKQLKISTINKDLICMTCLSHDRNLYAVEDLDMKKYCKDLQLTLKDKICWECKSTMSKFLMFTQKALRAQAIFAQWIKDTKNNPLPILSNLTTSSTHNLTCTGESRAVIENDIVVKSEPEDADLNIDTEILENDQYVPQDLGQCIDAEEIDIESKITVKIEFENLKETVQTPDKNPGMEQSQEKELCAELHSNRTVLTPPLLKKKTSPSQMINQGEQHDEEEIDIESKISVKIDIKSLKETVETPDKRPHVEQSQAEKLCAEVYNNRSNRTVLTPPLLKKKKSSSQVINQAPLRTRTEPTVGGTINTHGVLRAINLFTVKELTHNEMLLVRDKLMRAEKSKPSTKVIHINELPSQKSLDSTTILLHETGHYQCSICNQKFGDEALLRLHEKMHTRVYKCPNCPEVCLSAILAQRHYERCPNKHPQVYECNECEEQFTTHNDYRRHKRLTHAPIAICDHCGRQFNSKHNLARHILIHSGNVPIFECKICKKKCRWQTGLYIHMKMHNNKKDEAAYCADCGIQFRNMYNYKNHLKNTLNHVKKQDWRFPCPHCEKRFNSNSYLKCHIESMHSNKLNHPCKMCDQSFKTRIRLRAHARRAHEGYVQPRNNMCNVCGHTFKEKSTLKQHMNSHTGKRPYVCETCGATFSYSGALYTHKKKHKRCRAMLEQKKAKGETNSESNVEQTTN